MLKKRDIIKLPKQEIDKSEMHVSIYEVMKHSGGYTKSLEQSIMTER